MHPRLIRVIIGSVVFGALMGWRSQLQDPWAKIVVAAAAGGVMGVVLITNRRLK